MEQVGPLRRRHAAARVDHLQPVGVAVEPADETEGAAVGHRPQRVAGQVPEDLAHLVGIGDEARRGRYEVELQAVAGGHLLAVGEQLHVLGQQAPDVERRAGSLARPGEAQEALDRAVEPVALFEQDVDQAALRGVAGQRARQHLHRAGDRRQRVADLVRQAGGELADRGHAVLHPQLFLHPTPAGQVLEDQDVAAVGAEGVVEPRDREPDVGAVAVVGQLDLDPELPELLAGRRHVGPLAGGDQPRFADRGADQPVVGLPQDRQTGLVDAGDRAGKIGGDQAAADRLDDVAVHDLQVRQVLALHLELTLGAGGVARQERGEQRHGVKAEEMDRQVVGDAPAGDHLGHALHRRQQAGRQRQRERGIEQECEARDGDPGAAAQQGRGNGDDHQVEQRERARHPSQVVHHHGDQQQVAQELDVGVDDQVAAQQPQQGDVEQGGGERRGGEEPRVVRRLGREGVGARQHHQQEWQQHAGHRHHADGDVPAEVAFQCRHQGRFYAGCPIRSSTAPRRGAGTWRSRWCR